MTDDVLAETSSRWRGMVECWQLNPLCWIIGDSISALVQEDVWCKSVPFWHLSARDKNMQRARQTFRGYGRTVGR